MCMQALEFLNKPLNSPKNKNVKAAVTYNSVVDERFVA